MMLGISSLVSDSFSGSADPVDALSLRLLEGTVLVVEAPVCLVVCPLDFVGWQALIVE